MRGGKSRMRRRVVNQGRGEQSPPAIDISSINLQYWFNGPSNIPDNTDALSLFTFTCVDTSPGLGGSPFAFLCDRMYTPILYTPLGVTLAGVGRICPSLSEVEFCLCKNVCGLGMGRGGKGGGGGIEGAHRSRCCSMPSTCASQNGDFA